MLGGNHRVDWVTTYPFNVLFPEGRSFKGHPHSKGDVIVGHDVWIGTDALILSGVKIGNGAVVGARSVVARSVAPYAVVAGNPARVVRLRFPEEQIRELERIAWWDWPIEKIQAAWPLLLSSNLDGFLERHGPE
jgi:acetyltransferase-like isoleucine patch superfamily enzyme